MLAYQEGKTQAAIARDLHWPLGTVATRLTRARDRLRSRLARRGVGLAAGLILLEQFPKTATAAVPAALADATAQGALRLALAGAIDRTTISANVASLTKEVLRAMTTTKLKLAALLVLVLCALGIGVSLFRLPPLAADEGDVASEKKARPAPKGSETNHVVVRVPSERDAIVLFVGTEIKEGEKVPKDRVRTLKFDGGIIKYRRLKKGDKVEEGQLLARLNDRLARIEHNIKRAQLLGSRADLKGAEGLRSVYQEEMNRLEKIISKDPKGVSEQELNVARAQLTKYSQEVGSKKAVVTIAEAELHRSEVILEMYQIRSRVRGVIGAIYKHPGEAVKAFGEPIVLVHSPVSEE